MSALFNVEILLVDLDKSRATLQLTIINPDQKSFYNTKSFALLLLIDPFYNTISNDAPILKKIPLDEIKKINLSFLKKKANEIIKKVELSNIINFPFPPVLEKLTDEEFLHFFSNPANLPKADVIITVKDNHDIAHLTKGEQWESGAFNII